MAHKKQRSNEHIMESESLEIVQDILPTEWVIRHYKPDYGVDIAVELFEHIEGQESVTETLGEWFFVQVKSVKKTIIQKRKVYPRGNVEKRPLNVDKENKNNCVEMDTIPYAIDTDLLVTIQSLTGIPVLLFLITLDTKKLYFICINDVIDKCILPSDDNFEEKQTKTIHIPIQNMISKDDRSSLIPLMFFAKRPKLYAAFAKFSYQANEVQQLVEQIHLTRSGEDPDPSAIDTLLHFIKVIKRYDFWKTTSMWQPILDIYEEILQIEQELVNFKTSGSLSDKEVVDAFPVVAVSQSIAPISQHEQNSLAGSITGQIHSTWGKLQNLNNIYEEICREWYLPTYMGHLCSYE